MWYEDLETIGAYVLPGDPDGWGTALLANVATWGDKECEERILTWGNHQKTRILVISPQVQEEKNYVENVLKLNPTTTRITFDFHQKPKCLAMNEADFLKKFNSFRPTLIVLAFSNGITDSHYPTDVAFLEGHTKPLLCKPLYLFMATRNVWNLEDCILTSAGVVNSSGLKRQIEEANLENEATTKVAIMTGGHGGPFKNGRVTPAGGVSCFTNKRLLEPEFYSDDLKTVKRLEADSRFDKIKFLVINIGDYAEDASKNNFLKFLSRLKLCQNASSSRHNINDLVQELESYRPTYIMIAWCFSSNSDLGIALRSHGMFSKLLMEHDLRKITNDPQAKLSPQQVEVIKKAALDSNGKVQYKDFHLGGSSGSGKTLLGWEIAKIKLAQLRQKEKGKVKLLVLIQKNFHGTPRELFSKLKHDVEQLKELYQIDAVIKVMNDMAHLEEVQKNLKEEISKSRKVVSHTIVFIDEFSTGSCSTPTMVEGELLKDITSMANLGHTAHIIYAHSPAERVNTSMTFKLELPAIKSGVVYSSILKTRYRNTGGILKFLQFYKVGGITLMNPNDEAGASLPPALPRSPHPVLWLDCEWDWKEMGTRLTREMAQSLIPEMKDWVKWNTMVLHGYEHYDKSSSGKEVGEAASSTSSSHQKQGAWRHVYTRDCAGIEEEVVIALNLGTFLSYEEVSRARRQLVVITGKDLVPKTKSALEKAESLNLLVKRTIKDKPDCIKSIFCM